MLLTAPRHPEWITPTDHASVGMIHHLNVVGVHLMGADDLLAAQIQCVTGSPVVLLDRRQVVSYGVA
jgi:hypothetical protein